MWSSAVIEVSNAMCNKSCIYDLIPVIAVRENNMQLKVPRFSCGESLGRSATLE
jgi:hypothetical protein